MLEHTGLKSILLYHFLFCNLHCTNSQVHENTQFLSNRSLLFQFLQVSINQMSYFSFIIVIREAWLKSIPARAIEFYGYARSMSTLLPFRAQKQSDYCIWRLHLWLRDIFIVEKAPQLLHRPANSVDLLIITRPWHHTSAVHRISLIVVRFITKVLNKDLHVVLFFLMITWLFNLWYEKK